MKIVFCFSGKTFKGPIQEILDDYRARISRYCPLEIIESKNLKKQGREGCHVVLSPAGKMQTSEGFAALIEKKMNAGTKNLFFYIGGPTGFDGDIEKSSDEMISFSKMTFNHQIIRIMLFEQVYRAFTIINREQYHK